MNPQEPFNQHIPFNNHNQKVGDELIVMRPGERIICVIKRHPIGLLIQYAVIGVVLVALGVIAFGIAPETFASESQQGAVTAVGAVVFLIIAVLASIYAIIANIVYWGNRWVVTSDSVTQIAQKSIFNRQSSQLSLHSIEDVTAEQTGILTHVFGFGVLSAQTAGEQAKFVFPYCPNPNYYAKLLLEAREAYQAESEGQQPQPQTPSPQPTYPPNPQQPI